jgi:hypothetical protein
VNKQNMDQCKSSAVGDEPRRMLNGTLRFGDHCSCHLHGTIVVGHLQALETADSNYVIRT